MAPGCWSTRPPWSRARRTGSARCPVRPRAPPASPRGAGAPEDEQPSPAGHPRGPRAPAEPPTVAGRGGRGVRPAGGFVPPVQGGGGTPAGSGVEGHGDNGQGVDAPALRSKQFLTGVADDQMHRIVAAGITGTEMPAWWDEFGGPLTG